LGAGAAIGGWPAFGLLIIVWSERIGGGEEITWPTELIRIESLPAVIGTP
jgi:hypothetical protein